MEYVSSKQLEELGWENVTEATVKDLNNTLEEFDITTPDRIRHFLSQCLKESQRGFYVKEDGNERYWIRKYQYHPYLGNNGTEWDAINFRGVGYIQVTGRENYQHFSNYIEKATGKKDSDIMAQGIDYVSKKYSPWYLAGFWWHDHNMNNDCDRAKNLDVEKAVEKVTIGVNGDGRYGEDAEEWYRSLAERIDYYKKCLNVIKDAPIQAQLQAASPANSPTDFQSFPTKIKAKVLDGDGIPTIANAFGTIPDKITNDKGEQVYFCDKNTIVNVETHLGIDGKVVYRAQPGDNLGIISRRTGVSYNDLRAYNPGVGEKFNAGTEIRYNVPVLMWTPDFFGFSGGGHVTGPGTGTSDSIPAWLSNGEYVIKANAVAKWGVNFLNAINKGRIPEGGAVPRYAAGGLVDAEGPQELATANTGLPLKIVDTFAQQLNTSTLYLERFFQAGVELSQQLNDSLQVVVDNINTILVKLSDPRLAGAMSTESPGQGKPTDQTNSNTTRNKNSSNPATGSEKPLNSENSDGGTQKNANSQNADSLSQRLKDSAKQAMLSFFNAGILNYKSFGDAFRQLASTVLQSLQKVLIQEITKRLLSMLHISQNAGGGKISGSGTGTSDSILSWLSNGEYIIKADAVTKWGTNFLDTINSGRLPAGFQVSRFAAGGYIGSTRAADGPHELATSLVSNTNVPLSIVNVTDPNEVGRYLQSRHGEKVMVNWMKNNAGVVRQVLNIRG